MATVYRTAWFSTNASGVKIGFYPNNGDKEFYLFDKASTSFPGLYYSEIDSVNDGYVFHSIYSSSDGFFDGYFEVVNSTGISGKKFIGWYTTSAGSGKIDKVPSKDSDFSLKISDSTSISYDEIGETCSYYYGPDISYYLIAKFEDLPKITITYAPDDNSTGSGATQTDYQGSAFNLKGVTFTRAGYTQTGWASTKGGGKVYELNGTYTFNSSITLYPVWTVNQYTVTFNANDGTVSPTSTKVTYNSTYGTLPTPTRTGYTFKGWFTAKSGGSQVKSDTEVTITANQTLYAQWTPITYTVRFHKNDGTSTTAEQTHTYGKEQGVYDGWYVIGHTLKGWATTTNGSVVYAADGKVKNLTSTQGAIINLYAIWEGNTYIVTFDSTGGSVSPTSKSVTYGSEYGELPVPTRVGYRFEGWYTAVSFGQKITSDSEVDIVNNQTLYARWTIFDIDVSLDMQGGIGGTTKVSPYSGAPMPSIDVPSQEGYEFKGYYTERDGKGVKYYNPDGTSARDCDFDGDIVLYAYWEIKSFSIKFKANGGFFDGEEDNIQKIVTQDYATFVEVPLPPERSGFSFAGWEPRCPRWMPANNDVVCNAQWKAKAGGNYYTVQFELCLREPLEVEEGQIFSVNEPDKVEGFVFKGWKVTSGLNSETARYGSSFYSCDTEIHDSSTVCEPSEEGSTVFFRDLSSPDGTIVVLSAVWEPITYTITYSKKGEHSDAEGEVPEPDEKTYGVPLNLPNGSHLDLGEFFRQIGWTSSEGKYVRDPEYPCAGLYDENQDATLYPVFIDYLFVDKAVKVTCYYNSLKQEGTGVAVTRMSDYGYLSLPTTSYIYPFDAVNRDKYKRMVGWIVNGEDIGNLQIWKIPEGVTELTVTPKYEIIENSTQAWDSSLIYLIYAQGVYDLEWPGTFNVLVGPAAAETIESVYRKKGTGSNYLVQLRDIKYLRRGYEQTGWNVQGQAPNSQGEIFSKTFTFDAEKNPSNEVQLDGVDDYDILIVTPVWTPVKYNISFDLGAEDAQLKPGYGYVAKAYGKDLDEDSDASEDGDERYSDGKSPLNVDFDEEVEIRLGALERPGYEFTGWLLHGDVSAFAGNVRYNRFIPATDDKGNAVGKKIFTSLHDQVRGGDGVLFEAVWKKRTEYTLRLHAAPEGFITGGPNDRYYDMKVNLYEEAQLPSYEDAGKEAGFTAEGVEVIGWRLGSEEEGEGNETKILPEGAKVLNLGFSMDDKESISLEEENKVVNLFPVLKSVNNEDNTVELRVDNYWTESLFSALFVEEAVSMDKTSIWKQMGQGVVKHGFPYGEDVLFTASRMFNNDKYRFACLTDYVTQRLISTSETEAGHQWSFNGGDQHSFLVSYLTLLRASARYGYGSNKAMGAVSVTSEGVEPAVDIDVIRGGTVTFSAEAYPGFNFVGWYVKENFSAQSDLYSTSNDVEVRITSDITLYAAFIQDPGGPNNAICEWEGSGVNKTMEWKSKVYVGAKPFNPATCRIDACGYGKDGKDTVLELTVSGFSSPDSKPTSSATLTAITSQDAKRLPRLRSERYMQIGVKADVEIDAIIVGTSMGGLAV